MSRYKLFIVIRKVWAAAPHSDAPGQKALSNANADFAKDLRQHAKPPQKA